MAVVMRRRVLLLRAAVEGAAGGPGRLRSRLEHAAELNLPGPVESVTALPARSRRQRDALLFAFSSDRLVCCEYDKLTQGLRVSSMHDFSGAQPGEALTPPASSGGRRPLLCADPGGRAAALSLSRGRLALLRTVEVESEYGLGADAGDEGVQGFKAAALEKGAYTVPLSQMGLGQVRSMTFLHGYNEPVLLVLSEGEPTWSGRLRERKDTCQVHAFSLNLFYKRQPAIWTVAGLPYDAHTVVPVPPPEGGALVLCSDFIVYISQGNSTAWACSSYAQAGDALAGRASDAKRAEMPEPSEGDPGHSAMVKNARRAACVVSPDTLPAIAAKAGKLTFPDGPPVDLDLEFSHAAFVSPSTALLSLRDGRLIQLRLVADRSRVRALEARPCGACSVPSCAAALGAGLLFLGSYVGDSALLRFRQARGAATEVAPAELEESEERAFKRQKTDAGPVGGSGAEDLEEELFAGAGDGADGDGRLVLAVADRLANPGPVVAMATAEGVPAGSPSVLACCVGQGKHGALEITQQELHPERLVQVPLPNIRFAQAVRGFPGAVAGADSAADAGGAAGSGATYHRYLLLGTPEGSMVLETGDELREVTTSTEFESGAPTIAAGDMFGGSTVCQVCPSKVRLVREGRMVQELALSQLIPSGKEGAGKAHIASASIVEVWVLLLLSDGRALVLRGSPGAEPSLSLAAAGGEEAGDQLQGLSAASVFQDSHGWLEAELARRRDEDEEEEEENDEGSAASAGEGAGGCRDGGNSAAFAVLCFQRGGLRLCSLPDLTPVFSCAAFSTAREELCTPDEDETMPGPEDEEEAEAGPEEGDRVSSVRMESFPTDCLSVPLLFAVLGDGRAVAYRLLGGSPGLRLLKCDVDTSALRVMDDPPKKKKKTKTGKGTGEDEGVAPSGEEGPKVPAAVHRFDGVRGLSGFFVTGQRPFWMVVRHGFLWVHPMTSNGPVPAFSAFHNVNCREGFLFSTSEGKLDVCVLPEAVNIAGPWPSRRVALGGTPRAVTYLPESKLFALLVSARAPYRPAKPEQPGGDAHATNAYAAQEALAAAEGGAEAHEVQLVDPRQGWKVVWRHALEPSEQGLCLRAVALRSEKDGAVHPFLAVGTAAPRGEDYPCRGRALLLEVAKGGSEGQWTGRVVGQKEFRGTPGGGNVQCLTAIEGRLLLGVGSKAQVFVWHGEDHPTGLEQCGFFDAPMFITSLAQIKRFVLCGDLHSSVHFLQWQDQGGGQRLLSRLSHDFHSASVDLVEFLVEGGTLTLLAADRAGNLRFFRFDMADPATYKGKKLLHHAAFHVGGRLQSLVRRRMRAGGAGGVQMGALFAGAGVGLGVVAPVGESTYRRLHAVEREMVRQVPQPCGLHPVECHHPRDLGCFISQPPDSDRVLDGDLLRRFPRLSRAAQAALARAVASRPETILRDLEALASTLAF